MKIGVLLIAAVTCMLHSQISIAQVSDNVAPAGSQAKTVPSTMAVSGLTVYPGVRLGDDKSRVQQVLKENGWGKWKCGGGVQIYSDPGAEHCWRELCKVFKMGRHSVYAWTETLIRCVGLPLQCPSFYMDEAESSRNGLCYAIGRDDLVTHHDKKLSNGVRVSKAELHYLGTELEQLMGEICQAHPNIPVDYMYMETATCAYKGLHRRRRYLGYYLDRMAGEIRRGEKDMARISLGVDWGALWQIRSEIFLPEFLGERNTMPWFGVRDELCGNFMETGELVNLDLLERRDNDAEAKCVA